MTMIEALQAVYESAESQNYLWARPVSWRGRRVAIGLIETLPIRWMFDMWCLWPQASGRPCPAPLPTLTEMREEWEAVEPTVVNEGR